MLHAQVVLERLRDAGIILGGMKVGQPIAVTCQHMAVCEANVTHRSLQQTLSEEAEDHRAGDPSNIHAP